MTKLTKKKKADAAWNKEYRKRVEKVHSDPRNRDDHILGVAEMFNKPAKPVKEVDL